VHYVEGEDAYGEIDDGGLPCAAHDETVSSFGRNDGCLVSGSGEQARTTAEIQAGKDRTATDGRDPRDSSLRSE
jgi:hypothetical protein